MFYLSKILNKSLTEERCFLSTHEITCYEFINCNFKINNKYFIVEKIDIYTNLKINFDYFSDLIDMIHEINNKNLKINNNKKVLIDYFGVNFGKIVHFGHLRTLIYGNLIKKLYEYIGIDAKSDTHFGDSNIHICKYIKYFKNNNYDINVLNKLNINDFNDVYIKARNYEKNDINCEDTINISKNINKIGTYEFNIKQKIKDTSLDYINNILKKFHISFDFMYTESKYYSLCNFLINFGIENNLFRYDNYNRLITNNNIVLTNSMGEFLYAFIDIATIIERKLMNISKIIYVVDKRQSLHFKLIFDFIKNLFKIDLVHIKYGYIYNSKNQIISSRNEINIDILNLIKHYENLGYQIQHIVFAIYLYEIKHRMQSDYLFLENIFVEVLHEAKILYEKIIYIKDVIIKKENKKNILSNIEKSILTKLIQLYESIHICIENNILDRFCFIVNEFKLLMIKLDINNISLIFSKHFMQTIKLFNFIFLSN